MGEQISTLDGSDTAESVTRLLEDVRGGRSEAWDRIYALLYEDLRRIAASNVRRQRMSQSSPTSLVSEAWLRLAQADIPTANRSHLIALMAHAMRYVLLDQARQALSLKRGEGVEALPLEHALNAPEGASLEQLLEMDQALEALGQMDERAAKVVELRYFGGMKDPEVAQVLGITERTVGRDWRKARAFLLMRMGK